VLLADVEAVADDVLLLSAALRLSANSS